MILVPSLEILGGELVRLRGGAGDPPTVLAGNPLQTARELHRAGALFFHVVDLDAAFGTGDNDDVLRTLTEAMVPFQVRGGIESAERARELLALGADRVVLGSLCYHDGDAARQLVERFGLRIAAALDVEGDQVSIGGSGGATRIGLPEALRQLRATGVQQLIYNSVESPGEDAALDHERLLSVVADGAFQVYARCTVHSAAELAPLLELHRQGLIGVIVNHALAADSAPFADLVAMA
jgi:phosphoribosylformimino-5-aminoimidazole carboxamide ribonucleotide (ProFAR) isomerase